MNRSADILSAVSQTSGLQTVAVDAHVVASVQTESKPLNHAGYSVFITAAAAATVFAMSASVCAVDMNPASNCDGAR